MAQQEYIEKRTVLRAGLKITAPRPQITAQTVVWATTTTTTPMTTPYVVKLPTACTGAKTNMTGTSQSGRFKLPLIMFEPWKLHMITRETMRTVME